MGATARPRRAYRPRAVDRDPMGLAMTMAAKLTPEQATALATEVACTMTALREGRGNDTIWRTAADYLNVAEALAGAGIASDHIAAIAAGQQALAALWQRAQLRGSYVMRGTEITALDDALWLHTVQLQHCSQGEFEQARQRVAQRMQQARAGNAGAHALVCGAELPKRATPASTQNP